MKVESNKRETTRQSKLICPQQIGILNATKSRQVRWWWEKTTGG